MYRPVVIGNLVRAISGSLYTNLHQSQISSLLPCLTQRCQYSETKATKPTSGARKGKTPSGKLDEPFETKAEHIEPQHEREPLEKFPDNKNPLTGEIGGPRGPEPTRYGDWERKGRVSDF
uniref:Succinate dehydrogenase assembly factor 4, mitochondrial n=1 Tax=Arion vulgaris TaxID=1028688 RepID=A0A0B7AWI3_9EUPU